MRKLELRLLPVAGHDSVVRVDSASVSDDSESTESKLVSISTACSCCPYMYECGGAGGGVTTMGGGGMGKGGGESGRQSADSKLDSTSESS